MPVSMTKTNHEHDNLARQHGPPVSRHFEQLREHVPSLGDLLLDLEQLRHVEHVPCRLDLVVPKTAHALVRLPMLALGYVPAASVVDWWNECNAYQRGDSGQQYTKQQTMTAGNMAEPIISRQLRPVMPIGSGML